MILTKDIILKEIEANNLKITPFNMDNLGPASYDLTLASEFRVFRDFDANVECRIDDSADYKKNSKLLNVESGLVIMPGELVLGISVEELHLPENICAWIQGRSTFARLGLAVHITASFVQPGVKNRQVFEIFNTNTMPLTLIPGIRIGQLIFERCEGAAFYTGKFNKQTLR